jgi:hypothetical protein
MLRVHWRSAAQITEAVIANEFSGLSQTALSQRVTTIGTI